MEILDNQTDTTNFMSEQEVKIQFVPFLKEFYKYRYAIEPRTTQASFDNVSADGLVADGKLTFLKTDHEDPEKRVFFTCTFEATSRDKMEEIKFYPNISYLMWDSFAFAAAVTTGFYLLSYIFRTQFLFSLGAVGNLGLVAGFGILAYSFWFFSMKNWRKYRYIFAINQFKQYFADEQWCAIAGDIFFNSDDLYLKELREQCMFHGFGLAVVERSGEVRPIVTPSRLGRLGQDRKTVEWLTENKFFRTVGEQAHTLAHLPDRMPDLPKQLFFKLIHPLRFYVLKPIKNMFWKVAAKPFGDSADIYHRWTGTFKLQKTITFMSAVTLFFFLYKTLQHKDLEFANDGFYSEQAKRLSTSKNPENYRGFVTDGEPIRYGSIPKQNPNLDLPDDDNVPTLDLSGSSDSDDEVQTLDLSSSSNSDEEVQTLNLNATPKKQSAPTPKPTTRTNTATSFCGKVVGKKGWIVQDAYFSDKVFADERIANLKHRGLNGILVPGKCVDKTLDGYFVFFGNILASETLAKTALEDYRKTLVRYSLQGHKPAILREVK